MSTMDRMIREEARLILLRTLAAQVDGRLNSELLRLQLQTFGIAKPRPWVHDELAYLAEMGAVTVVDAGSVKVASLTEKGQAHIDRLLVIEGVKRPSLPGA
ncbi:hypothetical protein GJ689_23180 [Rhodoplanes serenus]|uniref:ArsR family transcriptional regulator n=1 Tax=Rhodoplanes serenus TaxID=200615 RepID=A0A9X4XUD3_9BRAD|nr:hypothetical protein [Rhodoplanes serenus]MTW19106.1 hypothetical protein [Rhodoplanes serenus]